LGTSKRKGECGIHHKLISKLERDLLDSGQFIKVLKYYEYEEHGITGEVDLLGLKKEATFFYEVKSNYTPKAKAKARLQFEKFKRAFPGINAVGYIYCGGGLISI
jgi:hypothetical protein